MTSQPLPPAAEKFLACLSEQLHALGARDADEIASEVRSHIAEALAASPEADPDAVAAELVAGFGDPRDLAAALLAERAEGERDTGALQARLSLRAIAWLADLVWAAWPVAALWPFGYLIVAMSAPSVAPIGLFLSLSALPVSLVLLGGIAFAIGWPVVTISSALRGRRDGSGSMGTRFARIVSLRRGPRVIWLDPEQAVGAGVPAPVSSMKARISVAVAALVIVSGVAWIPAVTAENEQQLGATMQRNELGSAREGEYLATARLWTAEVYDAALKHEMSAFAGHPPKGLTVDEAVLVQFATRLSKERVTGWSQNENIVGQAVAGDPINSGHASVTVSVTERTPRGDQAVSLHFSVTEPGFDGVNGRRRWVLDAIQSDQ